MCELCESVRMPTGCIRCITHSLIHFCVRRHGTSVGCERMRASIVYTFLYFQLLLYSFLYFVPFHFVCFCCYFVFCVLCSACGRIHNVRETALALISFSFYSFYSFSFLMLFAANFKSNRKMIDVSLTKAQPDTHTYQAHRFGTANLSRKLFPYCQSEQSAY